MKRILAIGGLLLAQVAMQGCMETMSGVKDEGQGLAKSDMLRPTAEEAFPGRTGKIATGYYRGGRIEYQIIDGKNVFQGDVLLDDSEITSQPSLNKETGAGTTAASTRWSTLTIPYTIDPGLANTARVTNAINHWSYKFNFVARTNQADYITFRTGTDPSACFSNSIGRKGGQQFIDLSAGCSTGNTVHEIGHAIGLFHEMSRQDRDNSVIINTGNILSGYAGNFNKYSPSSSGFDNQPFDFNSIMMYPATAFGITVGGVVQATITAKDGHNWGWNTAGLAEGDISTIEAMYPSTSPMWISSIARDANKLDVFAAWSNGSVSTAAWDQNVDGANGFRGWWSIQSGVTAPGGAVDAVSRDPNKLDVFTVGTNGRVYTAAWDQNVSAGAWRGWWTVGSAISVYPGAHVIPVARDANKLDVFTVGKDGVIYTAAWDQAVDGANGFRGWWPILGGRSLSGGQLSAVTRGAAMLDVYTVGADGNVYQASWNGSVSSAWGGWWSLGNPGTLVNEVTAIARGQKIDLIAVGFDRRIFHRGWDGSSWSAWVQIQGGVAAAGSRIAVASRNASQLDVFALGADNMVYTAAKTDGSAWAGWWSVQNGQARPGSNLSAVSRGLNKLDVFVTGGDGKIWTAAWDAAVAGGWHGWWKLP